MLANNEREHATYRAQTRDERSDKRYGMLANQESMQPSAHKQESGAQIRVMAGSLEPCTGTRWTPRQKTWHARKQTRTVNHLACTLRRETARSQKTKARCRLDKRHGMLANNESMQPSAHRQKEVGAQTKDMAGSQEPCTGTR